MEIIGRLIAMTFLMLAACGTGLVLALAVYLLARNRLWRKPALIAALFPPVAAAYLLACLVISAGMSGFLGTPDLLFGDINESLTNGYQLHALSKMPEAGTIQRAGDSLAAVGWVGQIQTSGAMVLGKYDYTYFPQAPGETGRNYFLFDTHSGSLKSFATETALADAAHTEMHLTPISKFRGSRTLSQVLFTNAMLFIAFLPPTSLALWLLWRLRSLLTQQEPTCP